MDASVSSSQQVPKAPPCVVGSMSLVGSQCVTVNNSLLSKPTGRPVLVTRIAGNAIATNRPMFAATPPAHQQPSGRGLPVQVPIQASSRYPLAPLTQQSSQSELCVSVPPLTRVLLKAVLKSSTSNKDGKTFTIRDVDTARISSCGAMKALIREQLNDDIVTEDFDVGFLNGSSVVRIRNKKDLFDVWSALRKPGSKVTLWCDGLVDRRGAGNSRKRPQSDEPGSDSESTVTRPKKKQVDRDRKVQDIVDDLKGTHASNYTQMQLRIWAEMIASGMHLSLSDPPSTSMFTRAGGGTPYKKKEPSPTQSLTDAVTAIANALSPRLGSGSSSVGVGASPVKVIESRSKLYKQLADLQNLENSGILTHEEYITEKQSIMNLLQQLKTRYTQVSHS